MNRHRPKSMKQAFARACAVNRKEYYEQILEARTEMDSENEGQDPLWPEDQYRQPVSVGNAARSSGQIHVSQPARMVAEEAQDGGRDEPGVL